MKFPKNTVIAAIILSLGQPVISMQDDIEQSVASAHPLATRAGMEILEIGGNAFDAAIAVASTLNVVEPMMSGLGGYGTILIYDAREGKVSYLNSSGRFPYGANPDLMRPPAIGYMENRKGAKSISTPGNLNAWQDMHKKYGIIQWSQLFEKAITHASNGFSLTPHVAAWLDASWGDMPLYPKSFYGKDGQPLKEGETLVQSDLGKIFEIISKDGPDIFYRGELAKIIDNQMKEKGSFLSLRDLEENKAEWGDTIKVDYKGYEIYTASPPANSFSAFVVISMMRHFDVASLGHNSADYLHVLAEMLKESCKARLSYSYDPDASNAQEKKQILDSFLSPSHIRSLASAIDMDKASDFMVEGPGESHNTTHFVVVDKWGNAVSATQTLGNMFGSRVMVEGTGIWMNSSMMYSTFEPKGNPMDVFPGMHKLSGDCPVIIMKDGRLVAALGTPGGHTITQNIPQIIFNLIDLNMTMQEAIDAPKITFIEETGFIRMEKDIPLDVIESLNHRGHKTETGTIGNATGISILYNDENNTKLLQTGIDKRRDGHASIKNASI